MRGMILHLLMGAGLFGIMGLSTPASAHIDGAPLPSLAPMLENVLPTVVNISTSIRVRTGSHPLRDDPFFRHFFEPRQQENSSLGSGVIVDATHGYILTNHHVIEGADKITVTTNDGRTLQAVLAGSDKDSDVAVIQVPAKNLQAIAIGRSAELRVGDFVVAIGSPFGLRQTVTSGIVSALGRSGLGIEGYEDFIQTDASINPGNSGGALVNLRGELVGINTAILSRGGGSIGIGLSIPIDMAATLMAQIVEHGDVRRGILGVRMQDLTPSLAEALGVPHHRGVVVSQVIPGSAADQIGMQSGDVIIRFNGLQVDDRIDLRNAVGLMRTGDRGTVTYFRGTNRYHATVTIQRPDTVAQVPTPALRGSRFSGASFEEVTSREGRRAVRVIQVEPSSPAERTGIRPKDIIYSINRRRVESVSDLTAIQSRSERVWLIRLLRNGSSLFLVVK